MKVILLQINKKDKEKASSLINSFPERQEREFSFFFNEEDIIDTVFYPKEKSKKVYSLPEGKIVLRLINGEKFMERVEALLKEEGVFVERVAVNFL